MSRVSLSRYLIEQTRSHNTPADLRFLIEVVARACKEISHAVSKGALGGVLGSMGTENVQGEVQKKLDVISNEIGAASVEYLQAFGYTAYAYMWALMARTAMAKQAEDEFYVSKLGTARFYFARLLPRIHSLTSSVKAGSDALYLLTADQF